MLSRNRLSSLGAAMRQLSKHVTWRARIGVAVVAVLLAIGTFVPFLTPAIGLPLSGWQSVVFAASAPFCHQIPQRSLYIAGQVLPLCARCSGMWIGITLGASLGVLIPCARRWQMGALVALIGVALSALEYAREQSQQVSWSVARFLLGIVIFVGITMAVSFDMLALWLALQRAVTRQRDRTTS